MAVEMHAQRYFHENFWRGSTDIVELLEGIYDRIVACGFKVKDDDEDPTASPSASSGELMCVCVCAPPPPPPPPASCCVAYMCVCMCASSLSPSSAELASVCADVDMSGYVLLSERTVRKTLFSFNGR
eukprot:2675742-Rhodomonas_salina.1